MMGIDDERGGVEAGGSDIGGGEAGSSGIAGGKTGDKSLDRLSK